MGKVGKPRKTDEPYLDAACICEAVIEEKDDAYSIIRQVNRLTIWETDIPKNNTLFILPLALYISFKAGNVQGTRDLLLYQTNPSGKRALMEYELPFPLQFQGGDTGRVVVIRDFQIRFDTNGTYWIEVFLGKKRYTSIPMTIRFTTDRMPALNQIQDTTNGK